MFRFKIILCMLVLGLTMVFAHAEPHSDSASAFSLDNLWLFIKNKYIIKYIYTPIIMFF